MRPASSTIWATSKSTIPDASSNSVACSRFASKWYQSPSAAAQGNSEHCTIAT